MKGHFIQDPISLEWIVLAPRRERRPDQHSAKRAQREFHCPFDSGNEEMSPEIMRVGGQKKSDWQVRVVRNIFPIAEFHEVVVHSPKHNSSFTELSVEQCQLVFKVFQDRYNVLQPQGYPAIFHNHGDESGESLKHGHSQIVVVPSYVGISSPLAQTPHNIALKGKNLVTFCPKFSQFPYETWIQPFPRGKYFGQANLDQVEELGATVHRVLTSLEAAHPGLSYNFYIYPGEDWYLRIMGRSNRSPGGFELSTGVYVNIIDPEEVVRLIS